jgi:hypothetical protein
LRMISFASLSAILILALVTRVLFDSHTQILVYAVLQGYLVVNFSLRRLTSLSAFIILFFLIYGIRPVYILFENDVLLLSSSADSLKISLAVSSAMFLALLSLLCICIGYKMMQFLWPVRSAHIDQSLSSLSYISRAKPICLLILLILQIVFDIYLLVLSRGGMSLYAAGGGAYSYLLPQVLQAAQIYILVIFVYSRKINASSKLLYFLSLSLFCIYTYFMKDISMFRGFYLTGFIAAIVSILHSRRGYVSSLVVYIPILFLLPAFRALGSSRYSSTSDVFSNALESIKSFSVANWWAFFDSTGDMNVFDTFVAALNSAPAFHPYFFSWIYAILHFIPRVWWPDKPESGMLVDMNFTMGLPFHPGLIGFYFLDGGLLWMFMSCFMTGFLLSKADRWISSMGPGYVTSALYGIVVINSLYAARGLFHFQVIQYVYMIFPVFLLSFLVDSLKLMRKSKIAYLAGPCH